MLDILAFTTNGYAKVGQAPVRLTAPLTPASSSPLARVWENR
jgi:hypothetical protein